MKPGLSYELDSDIHYYYHFKHGDLLVCEFGDDKIEGCYGVIYKRVVTYENFYKPNKWSNAVTLDRNTYQGNSVFTLNWDSVSSKRIDLVTSIKDGYLYDVTKCMNRNWKLELILGI
jgi:hypothetical protein